MAARHPTGALLLEGRGRINLGTFLKRQHQKDRQHGDCRPQEGSNGATVISLSKSRRRSALASSNVLALEPVRNLHNDGKPERAEVEAAVRTIIRWSGDDPDREGLIETPAGDTRI